MFNPERNIIILLLPRIATCLSSSKTICMTSEVVVLKNILKTVVKVAVVIVMFCTRECCNDESLVMFLFQIVAINLFHTFCQLWFIRIF